MSITPVIKITAKHGRQGLAVGLLIIICAFLGAMQGGGGPIFLLIFFPLYALGILYFSVKVLMKHKKDLAAWSNIITLHIGMLCGVAFPFIVAAVQFIAKHGALTLIKYIYIGYR